MPTVNKTLIIRFSSIGDIILASPLIRGLRKNFPSAQIDFATRKDFGDLVRYNPNLNRVYEIDTKKGFGELLYLKETIKKERYDLIVDIHNSLRSRYMRIFSGVKEIAVVNKRIYERTMLVKFKKNIYKDIISVSDRYIEPLRKFDISNDGNGLDVFIPQEILDKINSRIKMIVAEQDGLIIGMCPSAKHETKCWPKERFAELGIKLKKDLNTRILIFGGANDIKRNGWIAARINDSEGPAGAEDFTGQFGLLETAAAIRVCDAVISNDTGLMHMAAAMKKKVVAIFGSSVEEFGFFPVGTRSKVLETKGLYCRPCSHIGREECPEGHFRCMNDIQVEDAFNEINEIIKKS